MKNRGFTLIELIFVLAIMSIVTVVSMASYNTFNKSQSMQSSVNDVIATLQAAKSKAISQVKPSACASQTLQGYQVTFSIAASTYQLEVVCGTTTMLEKKTLPSGVTFATGTPTQVRFLVSSGVSNPAMITLSGNSTTEKIQIDATGNISTQ